MGQELELKFDPQTIEHLGIKMYSQLPFALAELVANAYDADATEVTINLLDSDSQNKRIMVQDNGQGMSFEEIKDNFLVIGRKRREQDKNRISDSGRRITGKKGLGKLALFGIGKTIEISSTKRGSDQTTTFILDWDDILSDNTGVYRPHYDTNHGAGDNHGTSITLSNLSRISNFDIKNTSIALAKLFNCFDENFVVKIIHNYDDSIVLNRELVYENINKEFEWDLSDLIKLVQDDYEHKSDLSGEIISSKNPMKQELRGITLYANGRLVNLPSFFGYSEAGYTFSYVSGWIDADFLDEYEKDIISTDRQSISWDVPEANELKIFLQKILKQLIREWSTRRKQAKEERASQKSGINTKEWFEKVPGDIRDNLEKVVDTITDKTQINDEEFSGVIRQMHKLIPPYTYYHYRHLHKEVQDASKDYYEKKEYYQAFLEAMKRYKNNVKHKAAISEDEDSRIVSNAFGSDASSPLKTTAKYQLRPNGEQFSKNTLDNIEEGQKFLSMGVVKGGRNVVSHEEINDLKASGLFTEMDCLDMLSILSHLFKRLDEAKKTKENK